MKAVIVAIPLSLAAGMAIGASLGGGEASESATVTYIDSSAPIEERLAALERIISEERDARLVLEDQLNMIYEELDQYDEEIPRGGPSDVVAAQTAVAMTAVRPGAARNGPEGFDSQEAAMINQLVEGGFTEDRANWIMERTAAHQWEAMQARYEARQGGEGFDWMALDPSMRLRAELGDTEYEQYLEASGQPSIVAVQSVMATSNAARAGLLAGDEIRSYNGQRIFNMRELQIATNQADPGSDVLIEVMRDGSPITVSVPAGPMGVQTTASGRGGSWRRGN